MEGQAALGLETLERTHSSQEPVQADAFKGAYFLPEGFPADVVHHHDRAAFVLQALAHLDDVGALAAA